ncbi:hypothetical protein HETIRDRAFT_331610, partial [Heterobasidion irregulare TC 32-1]
FWLPHSQSNAILHYYLATLVIYYFFILISFPTPIFATYGQMIDTKQSEFHHC